MNIAARCRGGVVLDRGDSLCFVDAAVACSVTVASAITEVPGLAPPAVGIALADDRVVLVLRIGQIESHEVVVCQLDGVWVALSGAHVKATGSYEADGESAVLWDGVAVPLLDVRALHEQAEAAIWRSRVLREDPKRR